jgi:hypothetical protein
MVAPARRAGRGLPADATVRARLTALGQQIFPREQQTPEGLSFRTLDRLRAARPSTSWRQDTADNINKAEKYGAKI